MNTVNLFESMASSTWQRICLGEAHKISQGEETITDLNLLEIARVNCPEVQVIKTSKVKEKDKGTDWEWWIGNNRIGWLRYAVQAKKISSNSSIYKTLNHQVNSTPQINILEQYAKENNAIPLYCFYNYLKDNPKKLLNNYWKCNLSYEVEQFGCTVTPSNNVRTVLNKRGERNFYSLHNFAQTKPWRCLVRCPLMRQVYQDGSSNNTDFDFENVTVYPTLPSELSTALERGFLEQFSSELYNHNLAIYPRRVFVANYVGE